MFIPVVGDEESERRAEAAAALLSIDSITPNHTHKLKPTLPFTLQHSNGKSRMSVSQPVSYNGIGH